MIDPICRIAAVDECVGHGYPSPFLQKATWSFGLKPKIAGTTKEIVSGLVARRNRKRG